MRLKSNNEQAQISGMEALVQIFLAYEDSINEDRAPLNMSADYFFPILEVIM